MPSISVLPKICAAKLFLGYILLYFVLIFNPSMPSFNNAICSLGEISLNKFTNFLFEFNLFFKLLSSS